MYASGRWKEAGPYEVMKVKKLIRNHMFKHVTFCKGEGVKAASNHLEQKTRR